MISEFILEPVRSRRRTIALEPDISLDRTQCPRARWGCRDPASAKVNLDREKRCTELLDPAKRGSRCRFTGQHGHPADLSANVSCVGADHEFRNTRMDARRIDQTS